jgi:hypothetical protein
LRNQAVSGIRVRVPRPTLLVAEPEPLQALSVRKLVLEAAKFNVLTAHSTREGLDLFHLFPNISMAILVHGKQIDCEKIADGIKAATDKVPIIYISTLIGGECKGADHNVPMGEPEQLLNLVQSLLGDPRKLEPPSSAAE